MFGLSRYTLTGRSMEPTLHAGDGVVVSARVRPTVGDMALCREPRTGQLIVKRVSARHADLYDVRGDNPSESTDSRTFGPLTYADVLGKVILY